MSAPYHLVIRLSALGDVLLTLPAIAALRESAEGTRIAYLTDAARAPLVKGQPGIDRVFVWPRDGKGRAAPVKEILELLEGEAFTSVIDLHHKVRTRRLARALARRRGVSRVALRRRTLVQTLSALVGRDPPRRGPHATRLYLEPLTALGLRPPTGEGPLPYGWVVPASARESLADMTLPAPPRIGLAPGSRWPSKDWPEASFEQLADLLMEEGCSVVWVGGPEEEALHRRLMGRLPAAATASTAAMDLPTLAALFETLEVLVSGDSGPAHLAAAVDCKVLSLFGPTAPGRWAPGPSGPRLHVLHLGLPCQPCSNHGTMTCPLGHHDCLRGLEVEAVHEALLTLRA